MIMMSMGWVGRRDGNSLFDLTLPEVVIQACPEEAANVDTVFLGDFAVAEHATYIAQGSQLSEWDLLGLHRQIS